MMKKLFYLLLGLGLFNTSPLLADSSVDDAKQVTADSVENVETQGSDEDC